MENLLNKLLINFLTSNTGGVINFKKDLITHIDQNCHLFDFQIYCLVSKETIKEIGQLENIKYCSDIEVPDTSLKKIFFYGIKLNKYIQLNQFDTLINFGDIPANVCVKQIFYFDWPYAVYDDYQLWSRMNLRDVFSKIFKRCYFTFAQKRPFSYIVQTHTMQKRLNKRVKNTRIKVIDVGFNKTEFEKSKSIKLNSKIISQPSLIYPTAMYPHKNIEILIDVAKILKERNIFINFKLTFSSQSGKKESNFINIVTRRNLLEYFTFTGRLSRESLVTEIKLSSGIIMPTLIETYGLPYLEAQIFKKVMFTSDRDFARELCGESAIFFDPLNPNDIAEKIIENIFSDKIMQKHVNAIDKEMKKRISWDESSRLILEEA